MVVGACYVGVLAAMHLEFQDGRAVLGRGRVWCVGSKYVHYNKVTYFCFASWLPGARVHKCVPCQKGGLGPSLGKF